MNKTLNKILEQCDTDNLTLTQFILKPTNNGNEITIVLEEDTRVKDCGGVLR